MTVVTDVVHRVEQFVVQVERDVVEFVVEQQLVVVVQVEQQFVVVVQVEQQVVVQVEQPQLVVVQVEQQLFGKLSQLFTTCTSSVQVEQQVVQVVGKLYLAGAAHSTQLGPMAFLPGLGG